MAEEFHAGVCGGSWWVNASRNPFNPSPCSYDAGSSFGWMNHHHSGGGGLVTEMTSASDDSGDSSIVIHPQQPAGDGQVSVASTLDMMGISDVWSQGLLNDDRRSEENYPPPINKNFYQDSFVNDFRQMNQSFPLELQQLSADSLISSFPLNSDSYGYSSALLQTLFDGDFSQPNYSSSSPNYKMNMSEILTNLTDITPLVKPNTLPKKQPHQGNQLQFSNNTTFWNATAAVLPSAHPQFRPPALATAKPNMRHPNPRHHKETPNLAASAKKTSYEPAANKRARVENPSPLPAFKVRKEKLGDRITALQQLVSPFGKTDTASVLQEAIEYIKFLHDQVNALSAPYLKNGSSPLQHQQVPDGHRKIKDKKGTAKDLSSRGLCLAPISSTFPVASETSSDFWTPTFGGGFR